MYVCMGLIHEYQHKFSSPRHFKNYASFRLDTVSEFHAEAPQVTASEGLAQGPYVAARARFEPTTFCTKGDESTNEPPHRTKFLDMKAPSTTWP